MTREEVIETLTRGESVATSVPASSHDVRAWVGILPGKASMDPTEDAFYQLMEMTRGEREAFLRQLPFRYTILHIEIPASFDFHEYDLHPEYIQTVRQKRVFAVEDVVATLDSWGVPLDSFDYPRRSDFPL